MAIARICLLACAGLLIAFSTACATQERPSRVGDIGINPAYQRRLSVEREAMNYYDYRTPKTTAVIRSNPAGALVEWYNSDGQWVAIGNTPTRDVVIEATGKPELFRVSAPGYLPEIRWVATTPSSEGVDVQFQLDPDLPYGRYVLGE